MTLKLNIREIRKANGLTLEDLAGRVSISVPHLSEVERGKKNVNSHLLDRISRALGVTPQDLIASDVSHQVTRVSSAMKDLSPQDQDRVAAFAEALLASKQGPEHTQ